MQAFQRISLSYKVLENEYGEMALLRACLERRSFVYEWKSGPDENGNGNRKGRSRRRTQFDPTILDFINTGTNRNEIITTSFIL